MSAGLQQSVKEPTRNDHLLDLVLTDIPGTEIMVGGKIQDHKSVLTKFNFSVPATQVLQREVWNYAKADWERLKDLLGDHDWSHLQTKSPSEAALSLTNTILDYSIACIAKRTLKETKCTHPWMNEKILEARARKREAEGTELEEAMTIRCSEVILQRRLAYIARTKIELKNMKRGSKQFCKKSAELLGADTKICNIPALKDEHGKWVMDPKPKADLLAKTFCGK